LIIVICGYLFGWKWTGLPKRTLWDWLALLIVPAVLAVGGYLLTERQRALDRELSTQQAQTDRELADERRQNDTLQAYLDGMSQLLTDKERPLHMAQSGDSLRTVARARTLTVLGRLDSGQKRSILEFLFESELIYKEHILLDKGGLIERRHNIVSLRQADLRDADLYRGNLRDVNLGYANLSSADLSSADLRDADLRDADLRDAKGATSSGVANELLSAASSLEGATMPDGQTLRGDKMPNGPTLEEWIKDRENRRENE
jgi:hypothetical protein